MNRTGRSLIFAHRGASKEAAENTRSAFDKALEYAVDGIETDVQLTRDEVAVLWHDRFLGKLGLPDKHIDDFDLAELRAMNFAGHFSAARSEGIMTLESFLDAYRRRCRLVLEIKNRIWEQTSRHEMKVRTTLAMAGKVTDDSIIISSFDLASLVYAQQCAPGFPLVYNLETDQSLEEAGQILAMHPFLRGHCVPIESLDDAMVALLRGRDKLIAVYTCNTDEEIGKALQLGVDILISDVPQKALQMRG
jgi:glycerophosphoryl diester phosphodiesterase